jgi:hypothetical protein
MYNCPAFLDSRDEGLRKHVTSIGLLGTADTKLPYIQLQQNPGPKGAAKSAYMKEKLVVPGTYDSSCLSWCFLAETSVCSDGAFFLPAFLYLSHFTYLDDPTGACCSWVPMNVDVLFTFVAQLPAG